LADSLRPGFVIVVFGPQAVTQQLGSNSRRILDSKIDQQLHRFFLGLTGLWPDYLPIIDKLTSAKETASEPGPWLRRRRPQLCTRKTVCWRVVAGRARNTSRRILGLGVPVRCSCRARGFGHGRGR